MIGLDSNILLRYFMQDDAVQSPKATSIIEGFTERNRGYVSHVVLAETAWVLQATYKIPPVDVAISILGLLQAASLSVQDEEAVVEALHTSGDGRGTFADALIGILASRAGCTKVLSFDKRAMRLPGYELL
jgi:predicted nucleic-acid-binding protein